MTPQEAYAWLHAQRFADGGPVQGPNQTQVPLGTTPGWEVPGQGATPTVTGTLPAADYGNNAAISSPAFGGLFSGPTVVMPQLGTMQQNYTNLSNMALGQQAPQVSYQGSNPWLGQQQQLAGQLAKTASGQGNSAADAMLTQARDNNVANAYAMAMSHPNNGSAARTASEQAGMANQGAAAGMAAQRAQEQQAAQGQLSSLLNNASGQSLNVGINNAQFGQQQMANNNSAALGYLGQLYNYNAAQVDAENKQATTAMQGEAAAGQAAGTAAAALIAAAHGAYVPGKAAVKGDSPKNDKVKAVLSPGEIVLPRSVTQSGDAPEKAAAFVKAILAKKGKKS